MKYPIFLTLNGDLSKIPLNLSKISVYCYNESCYIKISTIKYPLINDFLL